MLSQNNARFQKALKMISFMTEKATIGYYFSYPRSKSVLFDKHVRELGDTSKLEYTSKCH